MKKLLFIAAFILFVKVASAQTYYLTRGLPVAEIAGSGTAITGLGDDNGVGPFNIGFSFNLYGVSYSQFYIGANGLISFGASKTSTGTFPSSSLTNSICFGNSDLHCDRGGAILNYFVSGTAPNRILVVNFKNVAHYSNSSNLTSVQIQLYEGATGKIELHISNITSGFSRTIGIENSDATSYLTETVLNGNSSLSISNEMIRFKLPDICTYTLATSASQPQICAGQTSTLTATPSPSGTYTYQWYNGTSAIQNATSSTYSATQSGTYKVKVLDVGNCEKLSNPIVISKAFTPVITASTTTICGLSPANLSVGVSPSGTYTYQWQKGGVNISGATTASYAATTIGYYKAKVTNGGCTNSDSISISNDTAPTISFTTSPSNATNLCDNSFVMIFRTITPSGTYTYQWYRNNQIISTNGAYYFYAAYDAGTYKVKVTKPNGCAYESSNLTLTAPFTVNISPDSSSICSQTQLTSVINIAGIYTYQWYKDDSPVTGATQSTFTPKEGGKYRLKVTNTAGCSVFSDEVKVSDFNAYVYTSIDDIGTNTTVDYLLCSGGIIPVTTSAYMYLSNGLSYQWFKNGVAISGATASNYNITTIGKYVVKIRNITSTCTVRSDTIKVLQGTLPTISSIALSGSPSNFTICQNQSNYMTANVIPSGNYKYDWYLNNQKVYYNSAQLYFNLNNRTGAGNYKVAVSFPNSFGCGVVSAVQQVLPKFNISLTPSSFDFCNGGVAPNLIGTVASGNYTYDWKYQDNTFYPSDAWANVSPAVTGTSYQVFPHHDSDTNRVTKYRFVATRTLDNCALGAITTVSQAFGVGYFEIYPDTLKICSGGIIKIKAYTRGVAGTITFQLYRNGVVSGALQTVIETDSYGYTYSPDLLITSAGSYFVRITRNGCSIDTKNKVVLATAVPNFTVTTTPTDPRICKSNQYSNVYLNFNVLGQDNVSYEGKWYRDTTLLSNFNGSSCDARQVGVYQARVTPYFGGCTVTANVTVKDLYDVSISPTSGILCENTPITLTGTVAQAWTYNYYWQRKDNSGNGDYYYGIGEYNPAFTPTEGGTYRLRINASGNYCEVFSDTVRIVQPFTVSMATSSEKICFGQNVALTATVVGSGNFTYQWYRGTSAVSGATLATYNTNVVGTYSVKVTKNGCLITSNSISITQGASNVPFTVSLTGSNNGKICSGIDVELRGSVSPAGTYSYSWTKNNQYTYGDALSKVLYYSSDAGVYRLTATDAGGCSIASAPFTATTPNIQVTVPAPTNTTFCSPVTLNATVTPAGGTYYYQWEESSNSIFGANSLSYTATKPGYYSFVVYGPDGCGVETSQISLNSPFNNYGLTVSNHLVGNTSQTNSYCPGQAVQLNAAYTLLSGVSGDVSYSWTGPKNFSSTAQSPILTNVTEGMSGEYRLKLTISGACNATRTDDYYLRTIINVRPVMVSIGGNESVCNNSTMSLSASLSNAGSTVSYAWAGPNGFTSVGSSISRSNFTAPMEGIYTVTATVTGQCIATVYAKKNVRVANSSSISAGAYTGYYTNCSAFYLNSYGGNGGASYSWSGPNGFVSNSQYPSSLALNAANAGIYTVTITECGVSATATTQVSVQGGNCTGNAASLYVSSAKNFAPNSLILIQPSVSPVSAENTFSWTGPNGFTSNSKFLVIPNAADIYEGVYTLTATYQSGYTPTSSTASIVITVDNPPADNTATPILSFSSNYVCAGENLNTQSDISTVPYDAEDYAIYSWQGPNGFTSEAKEPIFPNIAANRAGVYTVTAAFYGKYSGTATVTTMIGVNPTASISGNDKICSGSSIYLSANLSVYGSTYYSYSWQGPNNFTSTSSYPSITVPGTYSVSITKSGGFCDGTFTATKTITQQTGFESPNDLTAGTRLINNYSSELRPIGNYRIGHSFELYSYIGNSNSYSWTGPNGFTSTLRNPYIFSANAGHAGVYTVTANVQVNGCNSTTANVNVTKTVLINISLCPNTLTLVNPTNNYPSGIITSQANAVYGNITATNLITGTAKVTYQAKSIQLNAGFKADSGTVFKAEIGGCN